MADGQRPDPVAAAMAIIADRAKPDRPEPLFRPVAAGEPFPIDALPPVLRAGADGVQGRTQAPIALCAQSVLAVAGLGAAREANVRLSTSQARPLSLFLATVAASGERKSSADSEAAKPIVDWEAERRATHAIEVEAHRVKLAAWETAGKEAHHRHKKDRAALEAALKGLGPPPQPPFLPIATAGADPTIEGLWLLLKDGWGFAGVFSAEGGQFVGSHAMNPDNKLKTAAALSELWDGKPWTRTRRGDGVSVLAGRRIAMHLMLQPEAAALFLADPVLQDQGLLSRVLVASPPSTMGTRFAVPTPETELALQRYLLCMSDLWGRPVRHREGERGALDLRLIELAAEAARAVEAFGREVEVGLGEAGRWRPVAPIANKLAEHATRLAGVFALAENPQAALVTGDMMARAIALARFYGAEALRLFDQGRVAPHLAVAERVRAWLLTDWPEPFVSLPDLYQRGPRAIRDAKAARAVVDVLYTHGWLERCAEPVTVAGQKRRDAWRIVREGGA
jgi:hypothetical protein